MILAGDIGGTKSALGLFDGVGGAAREVAAATFRNADFDGIAAVLTRFIAEQGGAVPSAIVLGVAGPVIDGTVHMPNLGWTVEAAALAAHLQVGRVRLLNDLEAAAYGMLHLRPEDFLVLNQGRARRGNVGLIAAGTGLGEALLCRDGDDFHPVASEGGHGDFAPRDDREVALWEFLRVRYGGHVSYERVLSGPGVVAVYEFLRDSGRGEEPPALRARLASGDPAAVVTEAGLRDDFPICRDALDLFVSVYGAEAGNLALRGFTVGGLYVGGGIAPRLAAKLGDGTFMRSFVAKGRSRDLLAEIPVAVALEPRAPLLGAAHLAVRLASALPA